MAPCTYAVIRQKKCDNVSIIVVFEIVLIDFQEVIIGAEYIIDESNAFPLLFEKAGQVNL